MKTVAVIVHWGPPQPTVDVAERLEACPSIAQVAVVANDGSPRPDDLPAATAWLRPPRNLGFGGGFLHACRDHPTAESYLLVNNDIRIDEATVRSCLDLLAGTNIGIVAPTLVNGDGLQSGSARLSPVLVAPRARRPPEDRPCEADWVTGAVMFIKAEVLARVPFDGRYFLGFEDVDFCYRVRDSGWSVVLSPSRAWHTGSTMNPWRGNAYYNVRNRLWFTRTRGWRLRAMLVAVTTATVVLPRAVAMDLLRGRGLVTSVLVRHGLLDGLGPLPPPGDPRIDEPRAARWTAWPQP
ncbi:putative glycosyltransferase [Frankia canadensis]|uniref:Putative glycosyltransferase n=1 Tax=Frankia canadensis TaxID=1836972 RepID=A0A2I2KZK1_9ACTN|nr:glycosyltransferase family 2 protein [Frankia canadensis]SNQ51091.1 putative glycosyltransferase [Frankia canadensis]SOU58381.1 putative glycosyltransferase [Frankia canadensis]